MEKPRTGAMPRYRSSRLRLQACLPHGSGRVTVMRKIGAPRFALFHKAKAAPINYFSECA